MVIRLRTVLEIRMRVGPKGQVVIPKPMREKLGINPGDEVTFWLEGDDLRLRRAVAAGTLRGRLAGSELRDELEAEHRRELRKERQRARERGL